MTRPRVLVKGTLRPGSSLLLDKKESRRLSRVLRLNPGRELLVFDGKGVEARARVGRLDQEGRLILEVIDLESLEREPHLNLSLVQGLAKASKMEWVLQKATELGVVRLGVLSCRRSVPWASRSQETAKWSRWLKIIEEASRQCGRSRVPELAGPWELEEFINVPEPQALRLVLWEAESENRLKDVLSSLKEAPKDVWVVVGPEGGFESWEVQKLLQAGCVAVGLGPRILRTETAGIAVLALLQFLYGDLG
jgi:16S rRNA (uracil1498-N3)-methyltransferase